jgi:glycosyltransferase involved in cell wall biosynthesis
VTHRVDGLRVMQIILDLKRAGAQEVVRTLAEHLQERGCDVTVCAFQDGPMRSDIEQLGVKVEILRRPRYSIVLFPLFLAEILRIRRELARLIEAYGVEVAQTHILEVLDFVVLTLRRDTQLRVVLWTVQNAEFLPTMKHWLLQPKRIVYRLLYRVLASKVDGFIAVSNEVRQSIIRQIGPIHDKIYTISNAVDIRPFQKRGDKAALCNALGITPHSRLIATVGRLTEQKGHHYLIDAAQSIVASFPGTHFLFIGEGELSEELQCQVRQNRLSDNIHFLGLRDDVPDLLAAVDLFVLPSLWEGMSVALLEAMAAGKPIVATTVSGNLQAIAHGQTGLLVPPGDSRALANAVCQLLSNVAQAQAMGRKAQQVVTSTFSAQRQAEEHMALYHRLLSQPDVA